ncbi:MAG: class I SAM-dependent methyltransferase [Nostoc sp.]
MSTPTLSKNDESDKYIHGYTADEQDRLIRQSNFLASYIYIDLSHCHHIIEVGCGVGAQIQQLLTRWPHLKITGVDISIAQISRASKLLKPYIDAGQVSLHVSNGEKLSFPDESFDGAFICFVLEHTENPLPVLDELKRVMVSGSSLYCTEAFNASLYIYPRCQAIQSYWEILNRQQSNLNGDPDVGIKLCNLALKVNFSHPMVNPITIYLDERMKNASQRSNLVDWFLEVLLSAAPSLINQNKITPSLIEQMSQEFNVIKYRQESILFYRFQQMDAMK